MNEKDPLFRLCKDKGHCELSDETYHLCAHLLFYTAWFEELLYTYDIRQCFQNNKQICKELVEKKICMESLDFFGDYFSQRYLKSTKGTTDYFRQLRANENERHCIKKALLAYRDVSQRDDCLLLAYLTISYRFRNNMFHGNKGLINLKKYKSEFEMINNFFEYLLDFILKNGYHGYNRSE